MVFSDLTEEEAERYAKLRFGDARDAVFRKYSDSSVFNQAKVGYILKELVGPEDDYEDAKDEFLRNRVMFGYNIYNAPSTTGFSRAELQSALRHTGGDQKAAARFLQSFE